MRFPNSLPRHSIADVLRQIYSVLEAFQSILISKHCRSKSTLNAREYNTRLDLQPGFLGRHSQFI